MNRRKLIARLRKQVDRYENDPFLYYSDISVACVLVLALLALGALVLFEHVVAPLMYNLH